MFTFAPRQLGKSTNEMNAPKYDYSKASEDSLYIFLSIGAKGAIPKVVIYEQMQENLYNLAFGDYDPITKEISDESVSNNGDMVKVLATVIQTLRDFFATYPSALVMIQGSTPIRTKLYQRIIKNNLAEIETEFRVLALLHEEAIPEIPNFTKEYQIFHLSKL
jgi:hypothetical protein